MVFQLTTPIAHNAILILDGLSADDMSVNYLLDALSTVPLSRADRATPGVHRFLVPTKAALYAVLRGIALQCSTRGLRPILHVECHGDAESGIVLGPAAERVSWAELTAWLGRVNDATRCNLGVVMAACHGMRAIEPVHIKAPAPFLWMVGRDDVVTEGELRWALPRFYQTLWRTGALDVACREIAPFRWFNAEVFLFRYLESQYRLAGPSRRVNAVTDVALDVMRQHVGDQHPARLAVARRALKQAVRDWADPRRAEAMGQHFLGRRRQRFAYAHLVQWVQEQTARSRARQQ
jgi:hypothetical protein